MTCHTPLVGTEVEFIRKPGGRDDEHVSTLCEVIVMGHRYAGIVFFIYKTQLKHTLNDNLWLEKYRKLLELGTSQGKRKTSYMVAVNVEFQIII